MVKGSIHLLALAGLLAAPALGQTIRAELDGRPLVFDQPPIMRDGRLLVPLRGIFEGLGADVMAMPDGRIKATHGSTTVELTLGSRRAYINGAPFTLETPAASVRGRTMVPLRFVSEALGAEVGWDAMSKTVLITSAQASGPASGPARPVATATPAPQAAAPKLFNIVHNGSNPLREGESLLITATGDPGAQATVEIQGMVSRQPMREISSGRYELEIPVRAPMAVERGIVVVRLSRDGQETVQEASRTVTIAAAPAPAAAQMFEVSPLEGTSVDGLRPTVYVRLDRNVSPQTVRMFLDGTDVTNQAQYLGNGMQLTPSVDLAPGYHSARVQAVDTNGRMHSKDWNFNVRHGFTGSPGAPASFGPPDVNVTNLSNGANVGSTFLVQGTTNPYAAVEVTVQANTSLIPGVLSMSGRPWSARNTADAQGRFTVQLDASGVQPNTPLSVKVQANDNSGRMGPARVFDIVRR